eukprot:2144106-Rhodomonas_salina.1
MDGCERGVDVVTDVMLMLMLMLIMTSDGGNTVLVDYHASDHPFAYDSDPRILTDASPGFKTHWSMLSPNFAALED